MEVQAIMVRTAEFTMLDGELLAGVTLHLSMNTTQLAEFMKLASNGKGTLKLVIA